MQKLRCCCTKKQNKMYYIIYNKTMQNVEICNTNMLTNFNNDSFYLKKDLSDKNKDKDKHIAPYKLLKVNIFHLLFLSYQNALIHNFCHLILMSICVKYLFGGEVFYLLLELQNFYEFLNQGIQKLFLANMCGDKNEFFCAK